MMKETELQQRKENDPESLRFIVNKKHPIPKDRMPCDLVEPENVDIAFPNSVLRQEAATALSEMFAQAKKDGIHLYLGSAFRNYEGQEYLYSHWCSIEGKEEADRFSARPGYSEHHTGLAADMWHPDPKIDVMQCYENTPEFAWLITHAAEYGFVLRYPKGKEDVTGYGYEPWHFRYVGKEDARKIRALGEDMTLEEYYGVEGGDYDS